MSIRAFFNSVREGFRGIARHPLVTVASVTTILLMLILMSTFFIFSANARSMMKKLGQQPPIEVYMKLNADVDEINQTSKLIFEDSRVIEVFLNSPEQNYNSFKDYGWLVQDKEEKLYVYAQSMNATGRSRSFKSSMILLVKISQPLPL